MSHIKQRIITYQQSAETMSLLRYNQACIIIQGSEILIFLFKIQDIFIFIAPARMCYFVISPVHLQINLRVLSNIHDMEHFAKIVNDF